ncbi:hypothetical protein CC86DRAFT_394386 [Ophiobolus disseminans]|uniref:Cupredoxin n=1 Tax=Ophiobolus disseminans TaxID=1469910 RepID=A0A6A6ZZY9_9PLEO|nr:hypothetical protein CC86DRAFT_394386 [Ophiobolus disseminans]
MARSSLSKLGSVVVASQLLLSVLAQNIAVGSSNVHLIKVGAGEFKFEPQQITNVAVGDTVTFEFYPPDHSVARAEFGSACVPYGSTGKGKQGFWSGTKYVDSVDQTEQYNITINSTEPIFFYCAAPKSCTSELMVGAINPNSTQTLEKQIEAAKNAKFQYAPGQPMPSEGGNTSPSDPSSPQHDRPYKISTIVVIGVAVGIVAFIGMCAALFFFIGRSKSLKEVVRKQDDGAAMKPVGVGGGYTELGYQHFPQPPQTPHGGYPQDFGTPLPAYSSPHMGNAGLNTPHHTYYQDQKASQPVIAELHSPTLGRQEFVAELEAPSVPLQEKKR